MQSIHHGRSIGSLSTFLGIILWLAIVPAAAGPASEQTEEPQVDCVYVSLGRAQQLAIYHRDRASGALTRHATVEIDGTPGSMATSKDGQRLYVAVRSTKSVATFQIEARTGDLTHLGTTPVVENPVYLEIAPADRHLLMASYNGDRAAVYPLGPQGAVAEQATAVLETGRNPHSIMVDPSGRFVFVPNTGADLILQLRYDASTGRLEPNDPPQIATAAGAGPRHFFFHPHLPVVYFVNEKDSTVTTYRLDPQAGNLQPLQTVPTLPDDFTEANTCADIEVTPCGRFVYASNRGHDSLAGYRVDEASGTLTRIDLFPTEQTPRSFNIDPTGNFLYAAGQGNGRLASYRIDLQSGRLEPLRQYEVGEDPAWVQVVVPPQEK